jgi:hypothetical protein
VAVCGVGEVVGAIGWAVGLPASATHAVKLPGGTIRPPSGATEPLVGQAGGLPASATRADRPPTRVIGVPMLRRALMHESNRSISDKNS